jgi:hypothetical protein
VAVGAYPIAVNPVTGVLTYGGATASDGVLASGLYYFTNQANSVTTSATLGVGTLRVSPFYVPNTVTLSRIGAEVTSAGEAGSKFRLGVYADSGSGYPGALVLDAGTINGDSNTVQEISIDQALQPGMYWIGGAVQVVATTQPTMRVFNAVTFPPIAIGTSAPTAGQLVVCYQQGSVTGALPATFTATISGATPVARTHVKVA